MGCFFGKNGTFLGIKPTAIGFFFLKFVRLLSLFCPSFKYFLFFICPSICQFICPSFRFLGLFSSFQHWHKYERRQAHELTNFNSWTLEHGGVNKADSRLFWGTLRLDPSIHPPGVLKQHLNRAFQPVSNVPSMSGFCSISFWWAAFQENLLSSSQPITYIFTHHTTQRYLLFLSP